LHVKILPQIFLKDKSTGGISKIYLPQHFLYFLPLPQGQGEFLEIFVE
jgi:hypothetical protein